MTDTAVEVDVQAEAPDEKGVAGDTEAQATENNAGAGEDSGGLDDLDALLKEFESGVGDEPKATESEEDFDEEEPLTRKQVEELLKKQRDQEEASARIQEDIAKAVSVVKGDIDFPDDWVRGILEIEAMRDPRFQNAFLARHQKPDAWDKILKAKSKQLGKYLSAKEASSEKIADDVNAAVRSATTKAPAPKEEMSPMEALQKLGPSKYEVWKNQRYARKAKG